MGDAMPRAPKTVQAIEARGESGYETYHLSEWKRGKDLPDAPARVRAYPHWRAVESEEGTLTAARSTNRESSIERVRRPSI